ncbi:hypothetical protein VOI36_21600 [Burkholderia sp. GS2Y]|uniref:Uncharacterized protein n=1 Tax=Burkholderia theae TaxID=3143496 RepID=A0ABU9WK92_9BURK
MYTFGRVTVSLECRKVCVDGEPRYIGTRAFEILELLAKAAGVTVLVPPFASDGRNAAIVQFPGGYIAEIHASVAK